MASRTDDQSATPAAAPAIENSPEPEIDESFRIVYDSPCLAVVSKSGNIPCHASGRFKRNTLERVLLEKASFPAVFFTSRLDRETSGATLVAKTVETAGALGRAMMRHEIEKTYLCIARGAWPAVPLGDDGWSVVSGDLFPAADANVHKFRVFLPDDNSTFSDSAAAAKYDPSIRFTGAPQRATTKIRQIPWKTLGITDARALPFVALECMPVTGRTHQIRATVHALGLEVLGDKLYGPDRSIYARMCEGCMTNADAEALVLPRQALHSWRLSLRDPLTGERIDAVAPPDELVSEFAATLG